MEGSKEDYYTNYTKCIDNIYENFINLRSVIQNLFDYDVLYYS